MSSTSLKKRRIQNIENYNHNFLVISPNTIRKAIDLELIKIIKKVNRKRNDNVYYKVNNGSNNVLLHIKYDNYIIIDNIIKSCQNKEINIVNELMKFSFCTKHTGAYRDRVICGINKKYKYLGVSQITIERIIQSFYLYGKLTNLGSNMDVHHRGVTYINKLNNHELLSKQEHHKESNKRHVAGIYIDSITEFNNFIEKL